MFLSTAREGLLSDGFLLGWELSSVPGGREEDERAAVRPIGKLSSVPVGLCSGQVQVIRWDKGRVGCGKGDQDLRINALAPMCLPHPCPHQDRATRRDEEPRWCPKSSPWGSVQDLATCGTRGLGSPPHNGFC